MRSSVNLASSATTLDTCSTNKVVCLSLELLGSLSANSSDTFSVAVATFSTTFATCSTSSATFSTSPKTNKFQKKQIRPLYEIHRRLSVDDIGFVPNHVNHLCALIFFIWGSFFEYFYPNYQYNLTRKFITHTYTFYSLQFLHFCSPEWW